jgi:hypothetical protein
VKEKTGGIDWHNSKRRVELAKMRIQRRFSKENTTIACRFLDRLRLDNMSYGRIENYSGSVIRILQLKDDGSQTTAPTWLGKATFTPSGSWSGTKYTGTGVWTDSGSNPKSDYQVKEFFNRQKSYT